MKIRGRLRLKPKTRLKRIVARNRGGKKTKEKSISKLIKECDRLFSIEVRRKLYPINSNAQNKGVFVIPTDLLDSNFCFTCGKIFPIKKLHCGHYVSRWYKAARWDFDNCRPQCAMCNLWRKGDSVRFRQNLIKEIGIERVEAVEAKRDVPTKLTREFLQAKIQELQ